MKKYLSWLSIVPFFAIILLLAAFFNFKSNQASTIDNRKLTELPQLKGLKAEKVNTFTDSVTAYISDRIGFRNDMIHAYTVGNDKLFGIMTHPNYSYGRNGYVYPSIKPKSLDDDFLDAFAVFIKKAQDYCDERDIPFVFELDPSKLTVYPEHLPAGVEIKNDRGELLIKKLDALGARSFDAAPLLKEAKKETPVFSVKYDSVHWNDTGAFITISKLMEELGKYDGRIQPPDVNDYSLIPERHKQIVEESDFPIDETVIMYVPKEETVADLPEKMDYAEELGRYTSHTYLDFSVSNKEDAPVILCFTGSYFNRKAKFIAPQFARTYFIRAYGNVVNMEYYINLFHPDMVVIETAEHATTTDYYPQALLLSKKFNPNYKSLAALPKEEFTSLDLSGIKTEKGKAVTRLEIPIKAEDISYVYGLINGYYLDANINGEVLELTIDHSDVNADSSLELILISKQEDKQQSIILNI
ncbi:MAG: hypothetical protein LBS74_06765 [Oscillospiraceae bacterium]|jgi:hypothetical protein|nr:hypothetical protein [Oscillospiraceae bacterium]